VSPAERRCSVKKWAVYADGKFAGHVYARDNQDARNVALATLPIPSAARLEVVQQN
jgi:hypothetical protein